jgi:putative glutamine amidotransferase
MQPGHLVHEVKILAGSSLGSIIPSRRIMVNSRHHQAIKDPAAGLRVTARASDGLIEGVELPGHPFCLGVQWHPESLQEMEEHRCIFNAFITAASS